MSTRLKITRILQYIELREKGDCIKTIQNKAQLDEATVYTWELGYRCYLKKLSLDKAIEIIEKFQQ